MVPFEKSAKKGTISENDTNLREFSPNLYEKVPSKEVLFGKTAKFCNKKGTIGKSMKNHKQNWYHFSEESKFGNKSGTMLGNLPPICRKNVPIIQKKFKISHKNSLLI